MCDLTIEELKLVDQTSTELKFNKEEQELLKDFCSAFVRYLNKDLTCCIDLLTSIFKEPDSGKYYEVCELIMNTQLRSNEVENKFSNQINCASGEEFNRRYDEMIQAQNDTAITVKMLNLVSEIPTIKALLKRKI